MSAAFPNTMASDCSSGSTGDSVAKTVLQTGQAMSRRPARPARSARLSGSVELARIFGACSASSRSPASVTHFFTSLAPYIPRNFTISVTTANRRFNSSSSAAVNGGESHCFASLSTSPASISPSVIVAYRLEPSNAASSLTDRRYCSSADTTIGVTVGSTGTVARSAPQQHAAGASPFSKLATGTTKTSVWSRDTQSARLHDMPRLKSRLMTQTSVTIPSVSLFTRASKTLAARSSWVRACSCNHLASVVRCSWSRFPAVNNALTPSVAATPRFDLSASGRLGARQQYLLIFFFPFAFISAFGRQCHDCIGHTASATSTNESTARHPLPRACTSGFPITTQPR